MQLLAPLQNPEPPPQGVVAPEAKRKKLLAPLQNPKFSLQGVVDPEAKRKKIGAGFIRVFDEFARGLEQKHGVKPRFLVQVGSCAPSCRAEAAAAADRMRCVATLIRPQCCVAVSS